MLHEPYPTLRGDIAVTDNRERATYINHNLNPKWPPNNICIENRTESCKGSLDSHHSEADDQLHRYVRPLTQDAIGAATAGAYLNIVF